MYLLSVMKQVVKMDLELMPTQAYAYTVNELEKNLALAEIHAKQYPGVAPLFGMPYTAWFCKDCLRKHFLIIEGLAEEGINFTDNPTEKKFFSKVAELMRVFKTKVPKMDEKMALAMTDGVRKIRKVLNAPAIAKEIYTSSPKPPSAPSEQYLNTPTDNLIISERGKSMDKRQLGTIVASQFVGRGVQEAVAYYDRPVFSTVTLSNVVGIGGGLLGSVLSLMGKVPGEFDLAVAVVSSKLLADEVVKVAKQQMAWGGPILGAKAAFAPVSYVPTFKPAAELVTVD